MDRMQIIRCDLCGYFGGFHHDNCTRYKEEIDTFRGMMDRLNGKVRLDRVQTWVDHMKSLMGSDGTYPLTESDLDNLLEMLQE